MRMLYKEKFCGETCGLQSVWKYHERCGEDLMKIRPINYYVYGKENNYLLKEIKYEPQEGGFNCGFYVVSAICHFSESMGFLPPYGFREYSEKVSENIRNSAVTALFKRVEHLHEHVSALASNIVDQRKIERLWKSQFREVGLSSFILQPKMRFFVNRLESRAAENANLYRVYNLIKMILEAI